MKWKEFWKVLLSLLLILGAITIVFLIVSHISFHTTNQHINNILLIINTIVLTITLIVLIQYAKDTNTMATIQHDAQFMPSVKVSVLTNYFEDQQYYEILLEYSNNSNYGVSITEYKELYWFDQKWCTTSGVDNKPIDEPKSFQIPPNTTVLRNIIFDDDKTLAYLNDATLCHIDHLWVNIEYSPYYLVLMYIADNGFKIVDYTKTPLNFNLRFIMDKKTLHISETHNSYITLVDGLDEKEKNLTLIRRIMFAVNYAKHNWKVRL